jgi:hypothetical protein
VDSLSIVKSLKQKVMGTDQNVGDEKKKAELLKNGNWYSDSNLYTKKIKKKNSIFKLMTSGSRPLITLLQTIIF